MPRKDRVRPPSPRYAAAKLILTKLADTHRVSCEELTALVGSRISPEKRLQILERVDRLLEKLVDRCQKYVGTRETRYRPGSQHLP